MSTTNNSSFTPWDCGRRLGITFVAESACLSCVSVLSLLIYVGCRAYFQRHTPKGRFIRSHLDLYFLGLLFSDLIQALGGVMDIRWIAMTGVFEGHYCTVQGVLEQFGDVGVALCSMAIAVHTFAEIVLRWKEPYGFRLPIVVLVLYAVFLTLIVGAGYATHRNSTYYGDTVYWCWIKKQFIKEGIGLEYAWLWLAAGISLFFYIPIFLTLKQIIVIKEGDHWLNYRVSKTSKAERRALSGTGVIAHRMLYYPAVYIITVLPVGIVRIHQFVTSNVPFPAVVFAGVVFSASGFFNVVVYTLTRPALLRPSDAEVAEPIGNGQQVFFYANDPISTFQDQAIQVEEENEETIRRRGSTVELIPRFRKGVTNEAV